MKIWDQLYRMKGSAQKESAPRVKGSGQEYERLRLKLADRGLTLNSMYNKYYYVSWKYGTTEPLYTLGEVREWIKDDMEDFLKNV